MKTVKIICGLLFTGLTIAYILALFGTLRGTSTATDLVAGLAPVFLGATITFALFQSAFRDPVAKRAP
jgi:ABC-type uncharacterized transport system permease subunit